MVKIFRWDIKKLTDADFQGEGKVPPAFSVTSLRGAFPDDITVVSWTKPWDFIKIGPHILVSNKVKSILENHNAAAEFFLVPLTYRKESFRDWFYLRLLKEVDCLDPENTLLTDPKAVIPAIRHIALIESKCEGIPIFRIVDLSDIGVSDELALALRQAKCTGAIFQTPEEWRHPALHYDSEPSPTFTLADLRRRPRKIIVTKPFRTQFKGLTLGVTTLQEAKQRPDTVSGARRLAPNVQPDLWLGQAALHFDDKKILRMVVIFELGLEDVNGISVGGPWSEVERMAGRKVLNNWYIDEKNGVIYNEESGTVIDIAYVSSLRV